MPDQRNLPPSPFRPDTNVYKPESLRKAERIAEQKAGLTEEEARKREQRNR